MELAEVVMNPARQRIFQYLLVHDTATVKALRAALPDIPAASLYRHVKILMEHGVLQVVEERRVRGTVENVYRLDRDALKVNDDGTMVQAALLRISAAFAKYFAYGHGDPVADMLLMTSCTLRLTDAEFADFLAEINDLALRYMQKDAAEGCKLRQITLISAPTGQEGQPSKNREKEEETS